MKKVLWSISLVFASFILMTNVNALENEYLEKEWSMAQGYTWWDAINWTQTTEVDDGYLTTTLDSYGYGVLRKISKDGKEIIWESYNNYGLFYGSIQIYNNEIYTLSYDTYYGTYLLKYSMDGDYIDEVQIDDETEDSNPYIYGGELFIKDDKAYVIEKGYIGNTSYSDNKYGPRYVSIVDLKTFKYLDWHYYNDYSIDDINRITNGYYELTTEALNKIYSENNFKTKVNQQLIRNNYKYYVGVSYNDNETYGLVIKTDMNNNIIWAKKSKENNAYYYDVAYLGNDVIAVSSYTNDLSKKYPEGMTSEIRVYDEDGNIVETHDINKELGIPNSDILTLREYDGAVVAQVLTMYQGALQSFVVKYQIIPTSNDIYAINLVVSGEGDVTVNSSALPGEEVSFTVTPRSGYLLKSVVITDDFGNIISHENNKFIMPEGNVTFTAQFVEELKENPETGRYAYIIEAIFVGLGCFLVIKYIKKYDAFRAIK